MSQTSRSVTDLFRQYLHRQIAAQAEGLGFADPDGQVVPHEAVSAQPVDPRLAWEDALAVIRSCKTGAASTSIPRLEAPSVWPALVVAQEPAYAVAFCIGNFPQMVRNLQPLLSVGDLIELHSRAAHGNVGRSSVDMPAAFLQWVNALQGYPQLLLAAGMMRLMRRFDEASDLLKSSRKVPADWRFTRDNEEAALAWHRGNGEEALALWQAQKPSAPVLFNRGMAALFLGRSTEARTALEKAVDQLPETSSWYHLGHLYLGLAAARS
jgi:tetratricopeptide (TPR) repeat protein